MPVFEYKAINQGGKEVSGIVDADTARNARARLRRQGLFPTEVVEQESGAAPRRSEGSQAPRKSTLSREVDLAKYFQRVNATDVATMTSQLATLVGASIPMVEALTALQEQVEKPVLKVVIADIREKVNEGASFAKALQNHPKVFDDLYVNMVAAGEQSGSLDIVLSRLAEHTESMLALRSKVIGALIYPALMAGVGLALLTLIFLVVVPKVRRLFDSFGEALPLPTQILLGASEIFVGWWWAFLAVAVGSVWAFRRWIRSEQGRPRWHRALLRIPVAGGILRTVAVSRFCRTLSTLLASGVPILTALRIVRRVVGNDVLAVAIDEAAENIQEGQSVAAPLRQSGQFPPLVTHMISIGERTGDLEPMLEKVANAYDAAVSRALSAFTALLEPLLIIVMGGTIGVTALALLLPMLQMSRLAGS